MSVRVTAALVEQIPAAGPTIPATDFIGRSSVAIVDGGFVTLAGRGAPPRRELLWIRDLAGAQIGVVS